MDWILLQSKNCEEGSTENGTYTNLDRVTGALAVTTLASGRRLSRASSTRGTSGVGGVDTSASGLGSSAGRVTAGSSRLRRAASGSGSVLAVAAELRETSGSLLGALGAELVDEGFVVLSPGLELADVTAVLRREAGGGSEGAKVAASFGEVLGDGRRRSRNGLAEDLGVGDTGGSIAGVGLTGEDVGGREGHEGGENDLGLHLGGM